VRRGLPPVRLLGRLGRRGGRGARLLGRGARRGGRGAGFVARALRRRGAGGARAGKRGVLGKIFRKIVTVPAQTRARAAGSVTAEGGGKNSPTQGGGYGVGRGRLRSTWLTPRVVAG
jgi:hypothetical protein